MALSHSDVLEIIDAYVKRVAELTREDIQRDLAKFGTIDAFDQCYLRAYWKKYIDWLLYIHNIHKKTDDVEERMRLIEEQFGDQLGLPSSGIKPDVNARLDWLKRRVAKDFERELKHTIDFHGVTSPIEQIFLMEWNFARVEERYSVILEPQRQVTTVRGEFAVDFLIRPRSHDVGTSEIVIELDGHDFHEKTPQQATRDKSRERAIMRSGKSVLRFTGYEIIRNARGCVQEVEEFLKSARR